MSEENIHLTDVRVEEEHPEAIKEIILKGLREYNYAFLGYYEPKRFAIYIKNNAADIIAGVYGFSVAFHKVLRMEFVWVHTDYRKQGLGTTLLHHIDNYARSKGCSIIQVTTLEFQAKEFYKKNGYQEVGSIPQWFYGTTEIFLQKKLAS
ncbi:GNAT family N-acetyltransferase [Candidatus Odyssella thessalonicensis]|uniref:GNAT family N-acetyltransferase n=1 Tax=Candidatus Odyssella thessalonicensis TaxID=84647 RepID=UPI000225BF83|nr:GNAT family N-acetyltransferase [Candidatus Odyssella thessalonicensis]